MLQMHTLVLGRPCEGHVILLIATLGKKIVVIANNAKAFDLHFILNRAILLKLQVEPIMIGLKILCMQVSI